MKLTAYKTEIKQIGIGEGAETKPVMKMTDCLSLEIEFENEVWLISEIIPGEIELLAHKKQKTVIE